LSELSRRGFIGSAAAAASLVGLNVAADEEFSFKNNVPDPLLAGDELPTFKFELEKSEGKVIGGSYGKEATVKQLPISKGIAGVSMTPRRTASWCTSPYTMHSQPRSLNGCEA
jgi:oxalate decarboxylase